MPDTIATYEEPPAAPPSTLLGDCELRRAALGEVAHCDGDACLYWRALGHVGVETPTEPGCALQQFGADLDGRPELTHWLLSVKRRMEQA